MSAAPRAQFPGKLRFLFEKWRYKVLFGGRGGAKSWGIARALLLQASQQKLRVLCAREIQKSIADSVHKLLGEQIEALGLKQFYDVQQSTIRGANGSEFIFTGLHSNLSSIKSMEGLDRVWLEEAQTISNESLDVLIPTVRKEDSEIWISFNPDDGREPVYRRFVKERPDNARAVEIGWADNPWFPDVLKIEKDTLYARDAEAAEHVWGGKPKEHSDAEILRGRWSVESFEPKEHWHGPYFGADWGFAVNPTVLVKTWVDDKERILYVEYAEHGVGVDLDDTPALFDKVPGAKPPKHGGRVIWADSARPETISHMQRHGYPNIKAVEKQQGSIEDGIEHLRSYAKIVIHPRCELAKEQARLWSFKKDKLTGEVLDKPVDKHDDVWDATRYGLSLIIKAGKPKKPEPPAPPKKRDYGDRKEPERADSWKLV